jgi:hypothetical protein
MGQRVEGKGYVHLMILYSFVTHLSRWTKVIRRKYQHNILINKDLKTKIFYLILLKNPFIRIYPKLLLLPFALCPLLLAC